MIKYAVCGKIPIGIANKTIIIRIQGMKHTFIYNKANRTKNESGITRSRTHLLT